MVELIAAIMNNPAVLASVGIVLLLSVFATMYIVHAIKLVKFIPTPSVWWVSLLLTATAVGVNATIAEIGIKSATGLSGGAWLGGVVIALAYTIYGNVDPEKQLLDTMVKATVGKVTTLVDKSIPPTSAAHQADYTNN